MLDNAGLKGLLKKLLKPGKPPGSTMVLCRDYQFSTRRACGLIGFSRSSNEYRGRPDRHARIRVRLVTLSIPQNTDATAIACCHAKNGQDGFHRRRTRTWRHATSPRGALDRALSRNTPSKNIHPNGQVHHQKGDLLFDTANQRRVPRLQNPPELANGRMFRTVAI